MPSALSSSPPVLPIPRQPSPLSFSSVSIQEPPSPPASSSSHIVSGVSLSSSPASSRALHSATSGPSQPNLTTRRLSQQISPAARTSAHPRIDGLPIEPLPDSLLLRSTFNALDHSAATLKRLSKAVLSATSTYLALLEQVEKAEEDVFAQLGELGRWLESGYGVSGGSVWDDERGIRQVRKDARRREREEMEIMVEHGVRAVKGELKRNGLASGGAQARFEVGITPRTQVKSASLIRSTERSSSTPRRPSTSLRRRMPRQARQTRHIPNRQVCRRRHRPLATWHKRPVWPSSTSPGTRITRRCSTPYRPRRSPVWICL